MKIAVSFVNGTNAFAIERNAPDELGFTSNDISRTYCLRLTGEQVFVMELITEREKLEKYCKKLLEKQNNKSVALDAEARMSEELLDSIEEIKTTNEYYYTFFIDKTDGNGNVVGQRKINAPEENLKELQRQVVRYLRDVKGIQESDYAYAYVKGRSYVDGAQVHANARNDHYANFDIKNFFPSITPKILRWALKDYDLTQREINAIVKVSTWYDTENRKRCFPQGSVTSPYLSNIVFYKIDHKIVKMLSNRFYQPMVYTRYSDDITISSKSTYSRGKMIQNIKTLLKAHGFDLKKEKTKFTTPKGKNKVTGLTLNKDYIVTIGHKRKKWLKTFYHNTIISVINGMGDIAEVYSVLGELSFLYSVEPDYHRYIIERYNERFGKNVYEMLKKETV